MNLTIAKTASSYSRYKYRGYHHHVTLLNTWAGEGKIYFPWPCLYQSITILIPGHGVFSCGQSCACLTCPCPAFPNGPSWTRSVSRFAILDFREALETATVDTSCSLKGFHELKSKFVMYKRFFEVCSKHPILWWGWWWWHHYEVWVWCHRRSRSGGVDKWGDYRCTGYSWKDQE